MAGSRQPNPTDLFKSMVAAMKGVLQKQWAVVKEYAKMEAQKLAQSLATIGKLRLAGTITDDDAKGLLAMQKNASMAVLLAIEGIGLIAAQQAINAALDAVKSAVNAWIKFPLL